MAPKATSANLAVKQPATTTRSKSRSPARKASQKKAIAHYGSEGVTDNDIFLLPGSDFQLLLLLTVVASAVRLFRIYQPSSVVFDEVQ